MAISTERWINGLQFSSLFWYLPQDAQQKMTYVLWNGYEPSLRKVFPVWLKYVPGIQFRTDNGPFKVAMQKFTEKIVGMMKADRLFETQGGPIIISQIENEFGPVEWEISNLGKAYTKWAAQMVVGLNTRVPWIMCKQKDAPDPIIDTSNGFYCEKFKPNKVYKPKVWT